MKLKIISRFLIFKNEGIDLERLTKLFAKRMKYVEITSLRNGLQINIVVR